MSSRGLASFFGRQASYIRRLSHKKSPINPKKHRPKNQSQGGDPHYLNSIMP